MSADAAHTFDLQLSIDDEAFHLSEKLFRRVLDLELDSAKASVRAEAMLTYRSIQNMDKRERERRPK